MQLLSGNNKHNIQLTRIHPSSLELTPRFLFASVFALLLQSNTAIENITYYLIYNFNFIKYKYE